MPLLVWVGPDTMWSPEVETLEVGSLTGRQSPPIAARRPGNGDVQLSRLCSLVFSALDENHEMHSGIRKCPLPFDVPFGGTNWRPPRRTPLHYTRSSRSSNPGRERRSMRKAPVGKPSSIREPARNPVRQVGSVRIGPNIEGGGRRSEVPIRGWCQAGASPVSTCFRMAAL